MMMPEVGSMPKVSGSSIATPEGGPTPGSAPIRMPIITPATAIRMLKGVKATPNPIPRWVRKSTAGSENPQLAFGKRHVQPVHEHQPVEARGAERDSAAYPPAMAAKIANEDEKIERGADHHAEEIEQGDERHRHAQDHQQVAQPLAARQPGLARIFFL